MLRLVLKHRPPVGHRVGYRVGHGLGHVLSTPGVDAMAKSRCIRTLKESKANIHPS